MRKLLFFCWMFIAGNVLGQIFEDKHEHDEASALPSMFEIKHSESGKCLGNWGWRPVIQTCHDTPGQKWYWEGDHLINNAQGAKKGLCFNASDYINERLTLRRRVPIGRIEISEIRPRFCEWQVIGQDLTNKFYAHKRIIPFAISPAGIRVKSSCENCQMGAISDNDMSEDDVNTIKWNLPFNGPPYQIQHLTSRKCLGNWGFRAVLQTCEDTPGQWWYREGPYIVARAFSDRGLYLVTREFQSQDENAILEVLIRPLNSSDGFLWTRKSKRIVSLYQPEKDFSLVPFTGKPGSRVRTRSCESCGIGVEPAANGYSTGELEWNYVPPSWWLFDQKRSIHPV